MALRYAAALKCPRLHVMAGLLGDGQTRDINLPTYLANLAWAANLAAQEGLDILIEPINTRDIPRFFLNRQDHAHDIIASIGASNIKVQMDLYHLQIVEGDVATKIRQYLPTGNVGHLQIAGVPERHEPSVGELNYDYLFSVIDEVSHACGWQGWIGCEYKPQQGGTPNGTSAGLGWFAPYRS
jgi:hydroxypyruvate isomerase